MVKRKTLAIPIRCVDYSNTSQVVSLFSREEGLLEGIAKGAHRPKNSFQGPFDLAAIYDLVYLKRRNPGLSILAEAEVVDGWRGLRTCWKRYIAASQLLEFLRGVSLPADRNPELFDLAVRTLTLFSTDSVENIPWYMLHFEIRALHLLGFMGSVDACAVCGLPWPGGSRPAYFNPLAGGLVCRKCNEKSQTIPGGSITLPGSGVLLLKDLSELPAPPDSNGLEKKIFRQVHLCLAHSFTALLERPLKMLRYQASWL